MSLPLVKKLFRIPVAYFKYTARGNLVGVITNGTAVLGLGNIGPLAAKPAVEGKAVLFKKFAGIDVFDKMTMRKGVTIQYAKIEMRQRHSLIGAMMIHKGHADGMICGTFGTTGLHLHYIDQVLGKRDGVNVYAAMSTVLLPNHQVTLVDTHVNENPTAEQLAEIPLLAAEELQRVGISPKIALLSHSNFGSSNSESANKMRKTRSILRDIAPELEVDGEMHGNAALDIDVLRKSISNSTLKSDANLLVQPNIDAANISYNLLKSTASNGIAIGPILLGCAKPVHILTESATVRRIVNMTTLCVVDALSKHRDQN